MLDPAGKTVEKVATALASSPKRKDRIYEQEFAVSSPILWSLEERNLYRLVTEVRLGDQIVDRYETPFGIRTIKFDPEKDFP